MRASVQIFDPGHLTAQTDGDQALQREILTLFVRQSAEILVLLRDVTAPLRTRADLAHKLKGSAQAVGAFRLADAAETVETGFRAGHTSVALKDLAAAIDAVDAEISRYLSSRSDGH